MSKIVGIDLGTTNSVVAIVDGPQPRILENRDSKPHTRSAVGLKRNGEILLSETAMANWPMAPKDTIVSVKRLMGRSVDDPEVQRVRQWAAYEIVEPTDGTRDGIRVVMGGKQYSPIEISAMILKRLKEDASDTLKEEVTHAVITVPAYFTPVQKDATRRAALLAGLKVMSIMDEPTCAAIAFGLDQAATDAKTLLVYDLGGGTFDVSILVWSGVNFQEYTKAGDMWLGGDNFDATIVERVMAHIRREYGIDFGDAGRSQDKKKLRALAEIKKQAQAAKETLTASVSADIVLPGLIQSEDGDLIDVEMTVTREEFETWTKPLVDRTHEIINNALNEVGLTESDIDHVIMAGHASMIPAVQRRIAQRFGAEKIVKKVHPKYSVALGAALFAVRYMKIRCPNNACGYENDTNADRCEKCGADLSPAAPTATPDLERLTEQHYGIQVAEDRFAILVKKGTSLPTEWGEQMRSTGRNGQRVISIPVYAGEKEERASLNQKQGEVFGFLPPNLQKGTKIYIRLRVDKEFGAFEFDAHLDKGQKLEKLDYWILREGDGDREAKAAKELEVIEEMIASAWDDLGREGREKVEARHRDLFDAMKRKDLDCAAAVSSLIKELLEAQSGPQVADAFDMARNVKSNIEVALEEFGWTCPMKNQYRVVAALEQLEAIVREHDRNKVQQALDAAFGIFQRECPFAAMLFSTQLAIAMLNQKDPVNADRLMGEFRQAVDGLRRNPQDPRCTEALVKIMKELGPVGPGPGGSGVPCPQCGKLTVGRYCQNGHDTWITQ